ncbi:hypothetical protein [Sinomonas mesophila]|uniref:hypothetical protein n=1 Tax=Sinomonas mesophila TaxID=1531955 RepID=UPI0009879F74|nr:hypothetical protein [Sinomonas mesophila]
MQQEDPVYWSIDFPDIDRKTAEAIVDSVEELGLATDAIITPPDVFMTFHLDVDTVSALYEAVSSQVQSSSEVRPILTGLSDALAEWLTEREAPEGYE